MNAPPEMPEPHTQSAEAEQAQSEYEDAVARRRGWEEDPIVRRICELNSCQPEDVTPEMRRTGKMLLFQEMYGGKRTLVVGRGSGNPELTRLLTQNFREAEERACAAGLICFDEAMPEHTLRDLVHPIAWDFQHTAQDGTVFRAKGSAASMSTPFRKNNEVFNFFVQADEADRMHRIEIGTLIHRGWETIDGETWWQGKKPIIRDRVEDGVEPRKWQPAKSREIVKRGPVDQKQKAKNRAARKAAKRSRR